MPLVQIINLLSNFTTASVFAALFWLFTDALFLRFEIKIFLKAIAFGLLTTAIILNLLQLLTIANTPFIFWLQSLGLWLLFASFILDSHSKLQFMAILAILILFFLKNHALLAVQASLVAATVLNLAHVTKHNDLIPFGVGFVLIACAEFFYFLERTKNFEGIAQAGTFLYIFASITLFYWLWQYLVIRFNLGKKIGEVFRTY